MDRILVWNEIKIFDIERAKFEITLKILISYKIVVFRIFEKSIQTIQILHIDTYIYTYIYRQLFTKIFNTYVEILSIV